MSRRQALCRGWLLRHDEPSARDFWSSLPDDSDFAGAVLDNLSKFGPDPTGQADFALSVSR